MQSFRMLIDPNNSSPEARAFRELMSDIALTMQSERQADFNTDLVTQENINWTIKRRGMIAAYQYVLSRPHMLLIQLEEERVKLLEMLRAGDEAYENYKKQEVAP